MIVMGREKMKHTYLIDGKKLSVDVQSKDAFFVGKNEILSKRFGDLAQKKSWYHKGYTVIKSDTFLDTVLVKTKIQENVRKFIQEINPKTNLNNFSLETYHQYVTDEDHIKVIERTRSFYPADLDIDSEKIVKNIASYIGSNLSYNNSVSKTGSDPIVVRINRPKSIGYNPCHKDIYNTFDKSGFIPKMINVWIPVCGVNKLAGLPLAPGSHLIPEIKIERVNAGSILNGQKYNVNSILRWGNNSSLKTISPKNNEMLIFSSHLVHGLAVNQNPDTTRISLEFRLYEEG